jgi:hypothetical protein
MPRKLLIVNALLIAIAAGSTVFIARQLAAPMPMPSSKGRPSAASATPPAATEEPRPVGLGAYTSVAARNLFSPTRSEAPPTATTGPAVSPAVKPNLFGVVLRDGAPIAYLEDPTTKRVAGYRVGDAVAGGTVQTIGGDSVIIARPDGNLDVRLRDPARPRPAAVPAAAAAPGVPGVQPGASPPGVLPGVIPPAAPPPGAVPPQPGIAPPAPPGTMPSVPPTRRPLPPNLLRRLPQGVPPDATQQ